jgi:hypothetical protein
MFFRWEFAWVIVDFWVGICLGYGCFLGGNLLGLWMFSGLEFAWVMVVFWVGISLGYGCFLQWYLLPSLIESPKKAFYCLRKPRAKEIVTGSHSIVD